MLAALPLLTGLLLPCLLLPIVPVSAKLKNITIDDTVGDPTNNTPLTFSPSGQWSSGQDCPGCDIHTGTTTGTVDVTQVFDGTWHDSTYHPGPGNPPHTVTVTFTGVAVYVYNIIVNRAPNPLTTTLTNLTFSIDSEVVGTYVNVPDNTTEFKYKVLVYQNTSLTNGQHSFVMSSGGPNDTLTLFDYIEYTQDVADSSASPTTSDSSVPSSSAGSTASPATSTSSASTAKSSPPIGAIVGGVVGGVALVLLGLLAFCLVRARRREAARRPPPAAGKIDPFVFGDARRRPGQRMPRTPILPDLRFGRSRLMSRGPGSTTTTTDASSSTNTGDSLQGHRPRLPPMSPSAQTARSREEAEYLTRIQALEAQVRALEVQHQVGHGSDASGSRSGTQLSRGSTQRTRRSRSRNRSGRSGGSTSASVSASAANLRSELSSLRNEIAALRGELSLDQLGVLEPAPSYVS